MDDLKLAWRNVWRNTRRSVVTMSATGLALFVMIVYTGLVAGYVDGLQANILDLEVGDAQVFADSYREKPSLYTTIEDPSEWSAKLEDAGYQVSSRLLATGLGASEDNSSGVQLIGIDVLADADVSSISQQTKAGAWIEPDDEGVVIGWRLAETLGLEVGGELVVLSQGADGSMANDVYPIRGVLKGISDGVDRSGVFMTAAEFRELMVLPEGVHQMILRIPPGAELEAATALAQSYAPEGVEVSSWKTIKPMLSSMLESSRASMAVMAVIVYIAVGILILNAMLMAVFERIRELGVLKAIGFTPLKVLKLIFIETGIQTTVAVAAGVLLAIPANHYMTTTGIDMSSMGNVSIMGMAWDPVWRSSVTLETYTGPLTSLVVIVALAVLYPALRAAFIRPLDAIRD
ncbi:outer membrane-specific lipoprotein transporter subunit LolE [Enhygromyxa salina]|uniref:Outer membrane-specific lipoprotein transporter subunit LolE n=1 Tax=Enhygromyxa salina TaxID=215803 RepID=A0A2S9YGU1_9BACT|nr:FtsX-like permease family protein [Enhygromyxa salina]PRQ04320.1 outer membrane-specific lipoprotein transporter subunit LolE [Enhygromyxa salina]